MHGNEAPVRRHGRSPVKKKGRKVSADGKEVQFGCTIEQKLLQLPTQRNRVSKNTRDHHIGDRAVAVGEADVIAGIGRAS